LRKLINVLTALVVIAIPVLLLTNLGDWLRGKDPDGYKSKEGEYKSIGEQADEVRAAAKGAGAKAVDLKNRVVEAAVYPYELTLVSDDDRQLEVSVTGRNATHVFFTRKVDGTDHRFALDRLKPAVRDEVGAKPRTR